MSDTWLESQSSHSEWLHIETVASSNLYPISPWWRTWNNKEPFPRNSKYTLMIYKRFLSQLGLLDLEKMLKGLHPVHFGLVAQIYSYIKAPTHTMYKHEINSTTAAKENVSERKREHKGTLANIQNRCTGNRRLTRRTGTT